ncbi:alpha/beta hydrolase [Actinoplanes sp. NPDC051851]|uniref:alpha/beta fold hydrolase n=1 Tax=Actinoplanes sp. NPDC051851 TaxID=3154753 RepID=UPI0034450E45
MSRLGDHEVKIGDRTLKVYVSGAENGWPVFLLHGTPGSRTGPMPRPGVLYRRGICLISYDRPGYGGSTPMPGRRVVDAAADIAAIADWLDAERFSVVGRSGGGPHALAAAVRLPERVHRVATLVAMAPNKPDLDFAAGMTPDNVNAFAASEAAGVRERLRFRASRTEIDPRTLLDQLLAEMTEVDRRVVRDPAIQRLLLASYSEAVRTGPHGWIDDVLALRKDWGFEVSEIKPSVPVYIWHGAEDNFAPVAHARWLARHITDAILDLQPGRAHFGAVAMLPTVLTWLTGDLPEEWWRSRSGLSRTA